MLPPLCAFGLCVAVFCQHEILSPLEDFRGGRATSPGIWRRRWIPRTSGESWVLAGGLVGMFDPGLFSLVLRCLLLPWGQVRQAVLGLQARKEAAWASCSPDWLITGLYPWHTPCCRGPGVGTWPCPGSRGLPSEAQRSQRPSSKTARLPCELPGAPTAVPKPKVRVWPSQGMLQFQTKSGPILSLRFPIS